MIDLLAPGFVYTLVKDAFGRLTKRRRTLTQSEVVALRKKWKAEFEPRLWEWHREKLRKDVIIRDMKRVDGYPDVDTKARGVSPWFRAGLVGTYHKGALIGLSWEGLTTDSRTGRLRKTDYSSGETAEQNLLLIGSIPYENIENVDWDGDEFYNFPQIYAHFAFKKQPYAHIAYYAETIPPHGVPFYTEVATYEEIRRSSKGARTS